MKPTTWKSRPKFKSTVLNRTVVVGDLVILQCEVDGTPEPGITWTKDSQNVTQDNSVIIVKTSFKSVLTIKKARKIDQGKYSCKASNGFGPPIESYGSLDVEDRSKYNPVYLIEEKKEPAINFYKIHNCTIYFGT